MLQGFIDLNNRLFARFTPEARRNIGIHTCPAGANDPAHSKEVPYEKLLSGICQMNAGYFLTPRGTDDCGSSPFSRDLKPRHGSPDFARDVAMQKMSARLEGARMASEELGV